MSNYLVDELVRKRKARGLSQKELARLANLSQQHISGIESGKTDPRLSTIRTLALALGVRLSFLDEGSAPTASEEETVTEIAPQSMIDELRVED